MKYDDEFNLPEEELNMLASEVVKGIRKNKIVFPIILSGIFIIAIILFCSIVIPLFKSASQIGTDIGKDSGNIAGKAIGSINGVLDFSDIVDAEVSNTISEESISKDTVAEIANKIEGNIDSLGNLEVLVANVDCTTYHEEGNTYGALYLLRGKAVFKIDLSKAEIIHDSDKHLISIVLPMPTGELEYNKGDVEKLAEWNKRYFNGSDSVGFEAILNTINTSESINEEAINNYDYLVDAASNSAVKQIKEIAYAVRSNNDVDITVSIKAE